MAEFSTAYNSGVTLTNNNTTAETNSSNFRRAVSSTSVSSGKLSFEFTVDKISEGIFLGITSEENPDTSNVFIGNSGKSYGIYGRPTYSYVTEYDPNTGSSNTGAQLRNGDTAAFTFDADNGILNYSVNGGTVYQITGVPSGTYYPIIGSGSADKTVISTISLGQDITDTGGDTGGADTGTDTGGDTGGADTGGGTGVATEVIITLNGEPSVTIDKFYPYVDAGAEAVNDLDENVIVQVDNPVDTNVSGGYVITYTATDVETGISAQTTRAVTVLEGPERRNRPFDTFAVSTNDSWHRLPSRPATEVRLSNLTGRIAAARLRHKAFIIDDFEDGFDKWEVLEGTLGRMSGVDITGKNSAELEGRIAKQIPYLGDEYVIQIAFHSLYGDVKVGLFDSLERVGLIGSGTAGTTVCFYRNGSIGTSAPSMSSAAWKEDKTYILTLEVHPTKELFTVELIDGINRQVIAQGLDSTNELGNGGGVKLPGLGYYLGIEATSAVIDDIVYLKKDTEPHEIIPPGSSFTFPCERNINEYEVINLGSEPASYMDNTDNITLTGFYK